MNFRDHRQDGISVVAWDDCYTNIPIYKLKSPHSIIFFDLSIAPNRLISPSWNSLISSPDPQYYSVLVGFLFCYPLT